MSVTTSTEGGFWSRKIGRFGYVATFLATIAAAFTIARAVESEAALIGHQKDIAGLSSIFGLLAAGVAAAVIIDLPIVVVAKWRLKDVGLSWAWLVVVPSLTLRAVYMAETKNLMETGGMRVGMHGLHPLVDISSWIGVVASIALALMPADAFTNAEAGSLLARLRDLTTCDGRVTSDRFWRVLVWAAALYLVPQFVYRLLPTTSVAEAVGGVLYFSQTFGALLGISIFARRIGSGIESRNVLARQIPTAVGRAFRSASGFAAQRT